MEFFHGIVALLAFVVLVLAGMVAWLYMQQTRLLQAVNALAIAISTPPPPMLVADPAPKAVEAPSEQEVVAAPAEEEEDDRVSVHEEDILTQKGIPFNKSDKKTTLVSLIQATA